jgi:WD40 repeat protein
MVILVLSFSPIATATSGMAWAGAAESEHGYGTAVSYSPNGDIVASAHESTIMISDAYTHENIQSFYVDFFVESIEFTSDAKYLLIGMVSNLPNTPATVVYEFDEGEYVRAKHTEDGKNVDRISISHDDSTFATAIEDGSFVEWKMDTGSGSSLDIDRQYPASHSGHITCLDHSSDGAHLLSGATDGVIILWNRESLSEVTRWEANDPISHCKFSHDGSIMSWIAGGSLFLRNHDSTQSYYGQFDISMNATEMSFSSDDSEVAIMVPIIVGEQSRHIDFINIDSTPIYLSRTLIIPHNIQMFSIHPTDESVAVATLSELVVFYSNSVPVETEIPTQIDTDQDNIPDNIDNDDDGDGILDQFDNICIAGNNCQLQPNQETIRQFDISINGDEVIVIETIHLDAIHSSYIRQLAATSISENHRVDTDEFNQFEYAICIEYNLNEIKTRWATHLTIDEYVFNPTTVQCRIDSGLYGTNDNDAGTRISISWEITGRIVTSVSTPYNVSIISGIQTPSSSIAQNVHTFPVHIEIEDVSGASLEYEVWNRRDIDLFVTVQTSTLDDDDAITTVVDILTTYWYVWTFIVVGSIVLISMVIVRRRNAIDFDEYEDYTGDSDDDEEWEKIVDDVAEWDEVMEDEISQTTQPKPPAAVTRDIRGSPLPPGAVRRDLARQKREGPKPKMRKVRRTEKSTEREQESDDIVEFTHLLGSSEKPLDEDSTEDSEISDAIAHITSDSETKSKRKRPVRRKKPKD